MTATEPAAVDVWLIDLAGRDVLPLLPLLDPAERVRADRYRAEPARRLFIASRAAQRTLAARYLGTHPAGVRLARHCPQCGSTEHGRPHLPDDPDLDFSVTHTGELVALAYRRGGRVGIDVEAVDRAVDVPGMARTVLSEPEAAQLRGTAEPGRLAAFYRLWTRKEATVKLTGHGLTVPLASLDVTGERADVVPVPDGWPAGPIRLTDLPLDAGHVAALATTGAAPVSVRLRETQVDSAV
jgi:4'-phosphopantetheinyl transferase